MYVQCVVYPSIVRLAYMPLHINNHALQEMLTSKATQQYTVHYTYINLLHTYIWHLQLGGIRTMTFTFSYQLSYRGNRAGFKAKHLKPALMNIGELKLGICKYTLIKGYMYTKLHLLSIFGTISLVFNNIINDSN